MTDAYTIEDGALPDGELTPPLKIFINYRNDDPRAQGKTWPLYWKLAERFGSESVFFDKGTLRPGEQWFAEIKTQLVGAGAVIVLIGPDWLTHLAARMRHGGDDYVATEIDLALRAGAHVRVIPVLVDDARMPDIEELPPSLKSLPSCHVEYMRHTNLLADIERLIGCLDNPPDDRPPAGDGAVGAGVPGRGDDQMDNSHETLGGSPDRDGLTQSQVGHPPDESHYRMLTAKLNNLVIFLGAGANADDHDGPWCKGSTLPDDEDLAKYLALQVGHAGPVADLAGIAQYARAIHGEMDVFGWIQEVMRVDSEPGPVHRYLAGLPKRLEQLGLEKRYQMIVTPKFDAALERAFIAAQEPFDVVVYIRSRSDRPGGFVHLPWGQADPQPIDKANEYYEFPFERDTSRLTRTVIVRINGAVDDARAGFRWTDNYVVTEDHYIGYLRGGSAEQVVPLQILAKLKRACYLFLGYTISDWRQRVFLQWISEGTNLGGAKYWAVERDPDTLAKELWRVYGLSELYRSRLTDYLQGLDSFIETQHAHLR